MNPITSQSGTHSSKRLLLAYGVAVVAISITVFLVSNALQVMAGLSERLFSPNLFSLTLTAIVVFPMLLGSITRWRDTRGGGEALARRFGAVSIDTLSDFDSSQRLLREVEDLKLATALEPSPVWVLTRESGINACTLGSGLDTVLLVTQGLLDSLAPDEMSGVIAREYGHRLAGQQQAGLPIVLGGLFCLDRWGRRLCQSGNQSGLIPTLRKIPGYCLRLMGFPAYATGVLVRHLAWDSRAFAADASAVQYCRGTEGLSSALDKVIDLNSGESYETHYASELSHLSFYSYPSSTRFAGLVSSYPPVVERILAIDPNFRIKKQRIDRLALPDARQDKGNESGEAVTVAGAGALVQTGLTDKFELYVSDQLSGLAALFALFVSDDGKRADKFYEGIAFAYQKPFARKVHDIRQALANELDGSAHAVVDFITPILAVVREENKRLILLNLEKLIKSGGEMDFRNFVLLQHIRYQLDCDFPTLTKIKNESAPASGTRLKAFSAMDNELGLLLSLLVEAGGENTEQQDRDYKRLLRNFTTNYLPRRSREDATIGRDLESAFHVLRAQALTDKENLINLCGANLRSVNGTPLRDRNVVAIFGAAIGVRTGNHAQRDNADLKAA